MKLKKELKVTVFVVSFIVNNFNPWCSVTGIVTLATIVGGDCTHHSPLHLLTDPQYINK